MMKAGIYKTIPWASNIVLSETFGREEEMVRV